MPRLEQPGTPSPEELVAASGRWIPEVVAADLKILFCGINPGLYSGATGHHFAYPGNRFWKVLHRSGFTDRQLSPIEDRDLLPLGLGVTNLVERTTKVAADLSNEELREGARRLEAKAKGFRPEWIAVVGKGAYRKGFDRSHAEIGEQHERIAKSRVWLLPNTSGLNAQFSLDVLIEKFGELRRAALG